MHTLREEGYGNTVDHIYDALFRKNQNYRYYQNDEIDMEIILSILNRCVTHNDSLELGPYAVYCADEYIDPQLNAINRGDLDRTRDHI